VEDGRSKDLMGGLQLWVPRNAKKEWAAGEKGIDREENADFKSSREKHANRLDNNKKEGDK